MAISIDYSGATFRITIPQADLTLIGGTLYELDTDQFWKDLKLLESSEAGIVFQDAQSHNLEYTVVGSTYAQKIEILNATNSSNNHVYEVFFDPDTQYSVKLVGSNNNIFDLQNAILANTVTQVIPTNSAGLIVKSIGSGLSDEQDNQLFSLNTANIQSIVNNLDTDSIQSVVDTLLEIEGGKWHIVDNQLIVYQSDNTTEIMRFNLFDVDGASETNIIKRERV